MNGLPLETLLQLKPLISNFQTDTEFFFDDLINEKENIMTRIMRLIFVMDWRSSRVIVLARKTT